MAPPAVFRFAQSLEKEGDYSRAATEYKRYLHFVANLPGHDFAYQEEALFGLAVCLEKNGEIDGALRAYAEFGAAFPQSGRIAQGVFRLGRIYEEAGDLDEAKKRYAQLVGAYPHSLFAEQAKMRLAWLALREGEKALGQDILADLKEPQLARQSDVLLEAFANSPPPKKKSPLLAGLLSGVLPGAGHAYLGRTRDAGFAFLSNGLMIGAALESFDEGHDLLGAILTLVELGWYSGTVYSSVSMAHKYNKDREDEFYESFMPYLGPQGALPFKGLSFQVKF